jgi:putative copper export protein
MIFTGALMLRFLVIRAAARRIDDPVIEDSVRGRADRNLLRLASLAILLLMPATMSQFALEAGEGTFAYSKVWELLTADRSGHLLLFQLAVEVCAAVLVIPAALGFPALRSARTLWPARIRTGVMAGGLLLGLLELAARIVPVEKPKELVQTVFDTVLVFFHLVGGAVWIGGLAGLVVLAAARTVPLDWRRQFWPVVIRRFSVVAMSCVAAVLLSGLWLYWRHVGGISQLFTTLYGETLLVKLSLVGGLLLLGAFHQFWLLPRVEAHRAGEKRPFTKLITKHFRALVAVEVVLGLGVFLMVPMLSGSARNQDFQAKAADLSRTALAGSTPVSLRPSGLQPGLTDYDVTVPGGQAKRVALSFSSAELGIPSHEVVATSLGEGHYRAAGFYTPMAGDWQVRVSIGTSSRQATFTLPIKAHAAKLKKATPPVVRTSTWIYGLLEVGGVISLLLAGAWFSRFLTTRRSSGTSRTSRTPRVIRVDGESGSAGETTKDQHLVADAAGKE